MNDQDKNPLHHRLVPSQKAMNSSDRSSGRYGSFYRRMMSTGDVKDDDMIMDDTDNGLDEESMDSFDENVVETESVGSSSSRWKDQHFYDWRTFWQGGTYFEFLRWLRSGEITEKQASIESFDEMRHNLHKLARLLLLLREYHSTFGMPVDGGPKDQEFVLREVTKDLYRGGTPIWTLEPAMERAAEGLTGKRGVDFFLLPRKAFIFAPSSGATTMFRIDRGYDIQKLVGIEKILVRIASYASNTHGVSSLPTRLPNQSELLNAYHEEWNHSTSLLAAGTHHDREDLAEHILNLASRAEGLFFFINSKDRPTITRKTDQRSTGAPDVESGLSDIDEQFWSVEDHIAELFSRLATIDAIRRIDELDKNRKVLYPGYVMALFRFITSAGAAAFWFNGGWIDMAIAGACGTLVGFGSTISILSKEERVIFEVVASFLVGAVAGVSSLLLPYKTCFGAIGLGGILDILQGFRVVYAVIELMGKHTVSGGADFLEGLLFTGLIAYFLKLGQFAAEYVIGDLISASFDITNQHLQCNNGIDHWWFILFVPITATAWSGMFNPEYKDLPLMSFHGILAYVVTWTCSRTNLNADFCLFLGAMCVTFSSGLVSRFTGRQAMGNTVAGLYVLLPGAYLVNSLFTSSSLDFLGRVFFNAAIIGTGAWTGTLLCSPTILGTTVSLLRKQTGAGPSMSQRRNESVREERGTGAMLFF